FFGEIDDFGGDALALKVLYGFHRRIFRHAQHPTRGTAGNFAEKKFANFVDFGAVFLDPIVARDAAIQVAMLDVAADFLRANQADFQLLVVDVGNVGTATDGNVKTGLGHLLDGGILQTAFRQTKT